MTDRIIFERISWTIKAIRTLHTGTVVMRIVRYIFKNLSIVEQARRRNYSTKYLLAGGRYMPETSSGVIKNSVRARREGNLCVWSQLLLLLR